MQDNKKIIVVAALGLVIVGLGAFQFVRSNAVPPELADAAAKREAKKALAAKAPPAIVATGPKNPSVADNLPQRDPFEAAVLAPDPTKTPVQPAAATAAVAPPPRIRMPRGLDGAGQVGPLTLGSGQIGTHGLGIEPEQEKFGYRVSGVMLGAKPMAVFTDGQGNQRLLMQGGSLDPDSNVVSIDKDAVTVRFHGKNLRLTVEGNPNAK